MTNHETRARSRYLLFPLPFILAFIVWLLYPSLVGFVLFNVLKYHAASQPPTLTWSLLPIFFYTWYLFSAIGVAGLLVVAAWMWKQHPTPKIVYDHPEISVIVPVYNQKRNVSRCIYGLFNSAIRYDGLSEIIVIDDGSGDDTFETAWAAINSKHEEFPNIRTRVVRHTANLGRAEAIRTGANKAIGEYVAIVDADTFGDSTALTELVESLQASEGTGLTCISPDIGKSGKSLFAILRPLENSQDEGILRRTEALGNAITTIPCSVGLYKIEALRQFLNESKIQIHTVHRRNRSATLLSLHAPRLLGAVVDLIALLSLPFLIWFAPDRILFVLGLATFLLLLLTIGVIQQTLALKFAYNEYGYKRLLWYTKLSYIFGLIDGAARFRKFLERTALKKKRS